MVRTRKRFYGEEVSQSSSNSQHMKRRRLQKDTSFHISDGKRQKKSKERSFFTFDTSGPYPIECENWGQMNRIFGGCTPSTSTGRSSQSRSTSSISSGHLNKLKLRDALAELAHSRLLDLDDIERVEQYVTKCKTSLHVFIGGSQEYRASVVCKYLENDSQVPNSV
ncbi:hypothetical protein HanPI659440_Chr08g0297231 [Helianthus annuus]|nr:hypothetical protein HanPI659440_Chr08g0297231 [Helianthus annuus]